MDRAPASGKARSGHATWDRKVERLAYEGARAEFLATVQIKTPGRPTREQAAAKAWARLERARRGRGGHTDQAPSSVGAAIEPVTASVFDYVKAHWKQCGFSPSVREIVVGCELSSTSAAVHHLGLLEERGDITHEPRIARSIVVTGGHSSV